MAEPRGSGPIGPYPDSVDTNDQRSDYDKLRRRVLWKMPYGLDVIGSRGDESTAKNLMTANWSTGTTFDQRVGTASGGQLDEDPVLTPRPER